jgi:hypothetical protein
MLMPDDLPLSAIYNIQNIQNSIFPIIWFVAYPHILQAHSQPCGAPTKLAPSICMNETARTLLDRF